MSFTRLILCVAGVYSMFLLWAMAQERLSVPFKSVVDGSSDKFLSALLIGSCQSALSCLSAILYIFVRRKPGDTILQSLGLHSASGKSSENGVANGSALHEEHRQKHGKRHREHSHAHTRSLLFRYLQCSIFITSAAPLGFAALSYISYPAMVLGKSCKLVPVMIMNVILYRRRFAAHKYLVVTMVTAGITMFMFFGNEKSSRSAKGGNPTPYRNAIGIAYLIVNLALDGAVNSTQDEVFTRHKVTGQQMMFWINLFCTILSFILSVLPLPHIPVIHPSPGGQTELGAALAFIHSHPSVILPLAQFALTGALGQLFIFETLQHFGSLTLVTITLTRKMFTMLLSVVVYNHKLSSGQWLGAAVVFAGISVEAWVKAKDIHVKRIIQEKEKPKIKSL